MLIVGLICFVPTFSIINLPYASISLLCFILKCHWTVLGLGFAAMFVWRCRFRFECWERGKPAGFGCFRQFAGFRSSKSIFWRFLVENCERSVARSLKIGPGGQELGWGQGVAPGRSHWWVPRLPRHQHTGNGKGGSRVRDFSSETRTVFNKLCWEHVLDFQVTPTHSHSCFIFLRFGVTFSRGKGNRENNWKVFRNALFDK